MISSSKEISITSFASREQFRLMENWLYVAPSQSVSLYCDKTTKASSLAISLAHIARMTSLSGKEAFKQ